MENDDSASATSRQDRFFDTGHLTNDLKGRSVRGGAFTIGARGVSFCLRMGSVVVLARLLTPQDFGLIAMVMAFTGLATIFEQMGLSTATIQKKGINHAQVSTLFWINAALGLAIALIVCALARSVLLGVGFKEHRKLGRQRLGRLARRWLASRPAGSWFRSSFVCEIRHELDRRKPAELLCEAR